MVFSFMLKLKTSLVFMCDICNGTMRSNDIEQEETVDRINFVVCSSERRGKIVDVTILHNKYSVMEYRRTQERNGNVVHVCEYSAKIDVKSKAKNRKKYDSVQGTRRKWALRVQCLETEKIYDTIVECSKDVGISGYRIRRVLDTEEPADGFHFKSLLL